MRARSLLGLWTSMETNTGSVSTIDQIEARSQRQLYIS
jgi:hypothetical protein